MKSKKLTKVNFNRQRLTYLALIPSLFVFTSSDAKIKKPVPAETAKAKTMKEFAETPAGLKLKQKHTKATARQLQKTTKYPDGHSLTVTLVKNPAFTEGTDTKVIKPKEKKPTTETSNGAKMDCSTETIQLTANSTTFLNNGYSDAVSHLYPGAIFTFDNFGNGNYKEQEGSRYPITISTDNPNVSGDGSEIINSPNTASVRAGIDGLFRQSKGPAATESQAFQVFQDYNSAATSLSISGGGGFCGASVSAGYSNSSQSNSITMTIDDRKSVFSIDIVPSDSGLFRDANVEDDPNLIMIGKVSYGIRVLANLTATFNSSQEAANFNASYNGFGANAHLALNYLSTSENVQSTINAYVVGGPSQGSTISFDKKDLEQQMEKLISQVNYQNARPISYELWDMACDIVGSQSATDQFEDQTCIPAGAGAAKLESVYVTFQQGSDGRDAGTNFIVQLATSQSGEQGNCRYRFATGGPFGTGNAHPQSQYTSSQSATIQMDDFWETTDFVKKYGPTTMADFEKNGGQIYIGMNPASNKADTWIIQDVEITLNFSDGVQAKTFTLQGPFTLANTSNQTIYFDNTFQQRGVAPKTN